MRGAFSWTLTGILSVLFLVSILGELWVLPNEISQTTAAFPETASHATIGLFWGVSAITCCQVILISGWRLVALASDGQRARAASFRWVRAIVGCLLVLTGLVLAALVLLSVWGYSSPLSLFLAAAGLVALIAAGAVAVSPFARRPRARRPLLPVPAH